MTHEQLDEIRARCEAATPGPWAVKGTDRKKDFDFIAHAREDILALLAEIERLTKERDAAVEDLRINAYSPCRVCAHYPGIRCKAWLDCGGFNHWQWRGVQE